MSCASRCSRPRRPSRHCVPRPRRPLRRRWRSIVASTDACCRTHARSTCRPDESSLRELPGPAGAPTIVLLHGLGRHRRHQLLPLLPVARRALPRPGVRPPRPRRRDPHAPPVPARRLRRRRRGDGRRRRRRHVRPRRLLDGRRDRPAGLAGATRSRVGGIVLCATASHFNGTTARAGQLPRPRRARRGGPRDAAGAAPLRRRALPARPPRRLGAVGARADRPIGLAGGARSGCRARPLPLRPMARRSRRAGGGRDDAARLDGADHAPAPARRADPRRRRVPRRRRSRRRRVRAAVPGRRSSRRSTPSVARAS